MSAPTSASPAADVSPDNRLHWEIGDVVLDESLYELRRSGALIELEPKPLELLMFLLRRAGEVVTRDEILASLWPGRIVTDGVITNCVAKLREALQDTEQELIRTVPRFGYRLVGEVRCKRIAEKLPTTNDLGLSAGDALPHRTGWTLLRQLSSGAHGELWLAHEGSTEAQRVIKFARDADSLNALKREMTLNRVLSGSLGETGSFVRLLGWNLEAPPFYLESEYSEHGNLADWCVAQSGVRNVPLEVRLELAAQCAAAVAAAHSVGVLHKDLKPTNVIIVPGEHGKPRAQLCDFAAGRVFDPELLLELSITRLGFSQTATSLDSSGTPLYLAPELIAGQPPTMASDVYALGCILYQLVVGDFKRVLAPGWEADIADPLLCEDIATAAAGNPKRRLADAGQLALRLRSLRSRRVEMERQQYESSSAVALRASLARADARRSAVRALVVSLMITTGVLGWLYFAERRTDAARTAQMRAAEAACPSPTTHR